METCANCERKIGKLEVAHLFKQQVVCSDCLTLLEKQESAKQAKIAEANRRWQASKSATADTTIVADPGALSTLAEAENRAVPTPPERKVAPTNTLACPACGSVEIKSLGTPGRVLFIILFFPLGLLILLVPVRLRCADCGHEFKKSGMKLA